MVPAAPSERTKLIRRPPVWQRPGPLAVGGGAGGGSGAAPGGLGAAGTVAIGAGPTGGTGVGLACTRLTATGAWVADDWQALTHRIATIAGSTKNLMRPHVRHRS